MTESEWSSLGILPGREGRIWSLAYEKKFALLSGGHTRWTTIFQEECVAV